MLCLLVATAAPAQDGKRRKSQMKDSVTLQNVTVTGKSKTQRLREGSLSVSAIDIRSRVSTISSLSGLVDRTAGVKLREEGGVGSDFDLSINGMSGNSVRYFIDGVPMDTKGSGVTLANLPVNLIDRVEIYKGVVPTWLGSDALGGAVNIVTHRKKTNYLDVSYGTGSYHTHRADLNGQWSMVNGIVFRPTIGVNYSKNDYMMHDVEVWDEESREYIPVDRRRFHDDYLSLIGQLEVGVTDKWWADELFVSASYNKVEKEIQTGQIQTKVVGEAERRSEAWSVGLRYQKQHFLLKNLAASLSASHTWDHAETVDTTFRKYNWDGGFIKSSRNEITGRARSLRHYKRPLTIGRADLRYQWSMFNGESSMVNLSYALNRTGNDRWDERDNSFEPANDVLAKHVIGLSYNQSLFGGRLSNTFFLKDYVNHLDINQTDIPTVTGSREVQGSSTSNDWGGGVAVRFQPWEPIGLKASYEHSVRLPLARELLGNGTTIYANVTLEPEKSENYNVGLFGTLKNAIHTFSYEVNGFLRRVDNYIQPQVSEKEGMLQYVNVPAVHIKGVEGELRYDWMQRLHVVGNVTWQDARDRKELKSDGKPSVTFNNHVPNRPWFFATAEVRYDLAHLVTHLLPLTSHFYVGMDYQWVHWFYLSWEGYGALDTKARIPEKNIFGAQVTYSWQDERYNLSLTCENLFDRTVYDNYKLQKPGRTLFAKFRLNLH